MKLSNAVEALNDYLLSSSSPEDETYKALSPIRDLVSSASDEAKERINLIFKADQDPKLGWKTVLMMEEKKRHIQPDPKKDKLWASCYRQVQESQKKPAKTLLNTAWREVGLRECR